MIEQLLKDIKDPEVPQGEIYERAKSQIVEWDEWIKDSRILRNFDSRNNQYMLIVDRFDELDEGLAVILEGVPWKLVIDLDPDSDNTGIFTRIDPKQAQGGLIETITPSKINENHAENLMDPCKMPWIFANGRNMGASTADERNSGTNEHHDYKDKPKDNIREWKSHFKAPIVEAIRTISDKLDPMKPNFCIALSIKSGVPSKIATILLEEIQERFDFKDFSMRYMAVASELNMDDLDQSNFTTSNLSLFSFMCGIATEVGIYGREDFKVPGKLAGSFVSLKEQYNYLSEHLEILYKGCENIPQCNNEEETKSFKLKHLKSFISGSPISFPSLFYHHDATRSLPTEVAIYISRLSASISKPQIVQITHQPGSGGTTIARRVLWDLHETHPCAIVKLNFSLENFSQDSDGEKLVDNICDRIHCLEGECRRLPIILIDGKSALVRTLSDYVVRNLKGTAIILRCINHTEIRNDNKQTDKLYRMYFSKEFVVNPNLKHADNKSDHSEFVSKYDYYEKEFKFINKTNDLCKERVFHFPMLVLLGNFEKLKSIVNESLNIVIKERPRDYEVAIVVAFLQLYADRGTPASLISKYILKKTCTYDELTDCFSVTLMNLLIPEEAPNKIHYHSRKYSRKSHDDNDAKSYIVQQYTFQHQKIAEQVLDHSKRKLDVITEDFLSYDVFESYKKDKEVTDVINSLFLYNKSGDTVHFSKLVMDLRSSPCVARIFKEAAEKSKDVSFYSHVARFYAYRKFNFDEARQLIERGFEIDVNAPADKKRRVMDTLGHIVLIKMKKANISNEDELKTSAEEALNLFRNARDSPPRKFPNPLIGEVMVWLFCLEYIIREHGQNVDMAINYTIEDEFFCDAIADCFSLLDEVDEMVASCKMLPDPRQTERLAYEKRCRLKDLIERTRSPTDRGGWQDTAIFRICNRIEEYEKRISRKALLKLHAKWLMNQVQNNLALLDEYNKIKLFELLYQLVDEHNMLDHARNLMDVASLYDQPPFPMEKAIRITNLWQEEFPNDCYGYFYQYILCFAKICNGEVSDYKASYGSALDCCKKKIQGRLDQYRAKFYVGKEGEKGSICTLVSHAKLALIAEKHNQKHKVRGRREDDIDQTFWEEHCHKHLLVCRGRIQYHQRKFDRSRTFIIMEPGHVEISVTRNIVGTPYRDYQPDSKVSFIVALTLAGPKAKEVWFDESQQNKGGMEGKHFTRQRSKNSQKQEQ